MRHAINYLVCVCGKKCVHFNDESHLATRSRPFRLPMDIPLIHCESHLSDVLNVCGRGMIRLN